MYRAQMRGCVASVGGKFAWVRISGQELTRDPLIDYRLLSVSYGFFGKARFAGNGGSIAKKRNAVQKARTARPVGASRVRHCGVAALANMLDIGCGLRVALTDARSSEKSIINQRFPSQSLQGFARG